MNLLALLQATQGMAPAYQEVTDEPIVVEGQNRQPALAPEGPVYPDEAPVAPNLDNYAQLFGAQEASKNSEEFTPRKGMFGVKGTFRDVLGLLGDAFLIQSGNKPIYGPHRELERQADALSGFTQDPYAAIERLAYRNPGLAMDLDEQIATQKYQDNQSERALAELINKMENESDKRYQQYAGLFSSFAGSSDPGTYSRIRPLLEQLKKRGGLGDEFVIPETYDEALLGTYQRGGMKAAQQVASENKDQDQAWAQEALRIKEIGLNARDNPPPAPRPVQPTEASVVAPILSKLGRGEKLTPGEMEVLQRTGNFQEPKRNRTNNRKPVTASGSKFRVVGQRPKQ